MSGNKYFESKWKKKNTLSRAVPGTRKESSEDLDAKKKSEDQALRNSVKVIEANVSAIATKPRKSRHRRRHRHRSQRVGTKGTLVVFSFYEKFLEEKSD